MNRKDKQRIKRRLALAEGAWRFQDRSNGYTTFRNGRAYKRPSAGELMSELFLAVLREIANPVVIATIVISLLALAAGYGGGN